MNRRTFFRAAALGSAVTPAALTAASKPMPAPPPLIISGPIRDQTIRAMVVLRDGARMLRCSVRVPWRARWAATIEGNDVRVADSTFMVEPAPLWARLLGITRDSAVVHLE